MRPPQLILEIDAIQVEEVAVRVVLQLLKEQAVVAELVVVEGTVHEVPENVVCVELRTEAEAWDHGRIFPINLVGRWIKRFRHCVRASGEGNCGKISNCGGEAIPSLFHPTFAKNVSGAQAPGLFSATPPHFYLSRKHTTTMDLVQTVRKEGSRYVDILPPLISGLLTPVAAVARDFKWEDVKSDTQRENYLGHSVMARK